MLVVTSNWCVPDGSLSPAPAAGLVDRLRAEVRRASHRAGFRPDGSYRPVDGVEVVFAGDTFDWLTSREWTGAVRPWDGGRHAAAARERVVSGSLRLGFRLVATLVAWGRRGLEVPAADRRGRPLPGTRLRIPVRVALLRGDRDRWIERIVAAGAVSAGSVSVGSHWTGGGVTVRHGEEVELLWHAGGREPTLGESLAVELIARFGGVLHDAAGLRPLAAAVMRTVVGGRLIDAPTRLAGWLARREREGTLSATARGAVAEAWNRAVFQWHRAARRLDLGAVEGIDLAGRVAASMTLTADGGDDGRPPIPQRKSPVALEGSGTGPSGPCEILGHPPAGFTAGPTRRTRVLCIGPGAMRAVPEPGRGGLALFDPVGMISPAVDGDGTASPSASVVATGPLGQWLDWLPIGGCEPPPDGRHDESGRHGIWHSPPAGPGDRIVDAA